MVFRGHLKGVRSFSKWISIKLRYRKSLIWWEINLKVISTTFFAYLNIGCSRFTSGHPKWRYTEKVVKLNFRLISHQINDFLCLNFPNMNFKIDPSILRYAPSTTSRTVNFNSCHIDNCDLQNIIFFPFSPHRFLTVWQYGHAIS
jgi:hypothetical protein